MKSTPRSRTARTVTAPRFVASRQNATREQPHNLVPCRARTARRCSRRGPRGRAHWSRGCRSTTSSTRSGSTSRRRSQWRAPDRSACDARDVRCRSALGRSVLHPPGKLLRVRRRRLRGSGQRRPRTPAPNIPAIDASSAPYRHRRRAPKLVASSRKPSRQEGLLFRRPEPRPRITGCVRRRWLVQSPGAGSPRCLRRSCRSSRRGASVPRGSRVRSRSRRGSGSPPR